MRFFFVDRFSTGSADNVKFSACRTRMTVLNAGFPAVPSAL
jgi:hypothetical protein